MDIAGAVVTIDAVGCQKKIAQQIIQQEGGYVLSLKGNQGSLHEDVSTYFTSSLSPEPTLQTVNGEHGRIETRTIRVTDEIAWLKERHSWPGLQCGESYGDQACRLKSDQARRNLKGWRENKKVKSGLG